MLSGTAGVAGSDTAVNGAEFSAPGLGTSEGVAFNTSVNRGTLGRWALSASLPLISRERDAQGKQLVLSADVADLEWQEAQQTLMLTTAQRSEAITAQALALETDLQLKQAAFSDATGLQPNSVQWMAPGADATPASTQALEFWVAESGTRNAMLRMQLAAVEVVTQEAAKSGGALSPSLDLVAQVGRERLSGSGDFGNASHSSGNRMIGLQLSVPLYAGGMRDAPAWAARSASANASLQPTQAVETVMSHIDEPRAALLALGVEFRETSPTADRNRCCGGGASTFLIHRAAPLGHKAWQIEGLIERVAAQLPGPPTP